MSLDKEPADQIEDNLLKLEAARLILDHLIETENQPEWLTRRAAFLTFDLQNIIKDLRRYYGQS